MVCARSGGLPPVAIGIDRTGKLWSLAKPVAEADAGSVALWVRWHGRTLAAVPDTVGLVDIADSAGWTRVRIDRATWKAARRIDGVEDT